MSVLLLGVDGGFENTGYALVEHDARAPSENRFKIVAMGVLLTKRTPKVRVSADDVERAKRISQGLRRLLHTAPKGGLAATPTVAAFCCEEMSCPPNAMTQGKLKMVWGIIATLSEVYDLPVLQQAPMAIKAHLTGNKSASKEEVQEALRLRFPNDPILSRVGVRGGGNGAIGVEKAEHPFDALGAILTCVEKDEMQAKLRLWG